MNGVTLLAICAALSLASACGGSNSSSQQSQIPNQISSSGSNVQAITVNSGPNGDYANGAFTSVTLCVAGTSTCQTIDGILVDTGSSGLRVLSSALTISLAQQKAGDGNSVAECLPFVSGYTWGPVQTADVEIAGEKASAAPVQLIDQSVFAVPGSCSDLGPGQETLAALGANGILGVGNFAQDCGSACALPASSPQNPGWYFECPSSGCVTYSEAVAQQVVNPVILFATDNNGVILELPAVSGPEASISGSMVFGIGTQANNALNGATVYSTDADGNFASTFNNQTYNTSFLDSGSNGLYFLTASLSGIPDCPDADFFYCPSATKNLTATAEGANGSGSATISFSVANADNLFNDNPTAFVFQDLAGPNSLAGFDWGLPFFYGRDVFTAIEGQTTPGGVGPYWAF